MTKILTAVALAALIASPAEAAAFRMSSEVLIPAGGAADFAGAVQPVRLVIDPPDTGSVIIECGAGPTQTDLEATILPVAFATRTAPRPPCPRRERG